MLGRLCVKDFPVAQTVKNLAARQEARVRSLGWEVPLEKGMAIHSSILPRRIPRTENPGGLTIHGCAESDATERLTQSTGSVLGTRSIVKEMDI